MILALVVAYVILAHVFAIALCRAAGADSREEHARAIRENAFAEFLEHGIGPR